MQVTDEKLEEALKSIQEKLSLPNIERKRWLDKLIDRAIKGWKTRR